MELNSNQSQGALAMAPHILCAKISTPKSTEPLLLGSPVALHRSLTRLAGSAAGGVFLSQLWHWTKAMYAKYGDRWDGWVYKSADEWFEETGLTRAEQKTIRKRLADKGILVWSNKGRVCGTLQFWLDVRFLFCLLSEIAESAKPDEQIVKGGKRKTPKRISKSAKAITESTQENLKESTANSADAEFVVVSSQNEREEPAHGVDLLQRLLDKNMAPELASQCLAQGFEECELQLYRLSRERGVREPHRWLYKAIMRRDRDSDAYRKPRAPYVARAATDEPKRAPVRPIFIPQGAPRPEPHKVAPVSETPPPPQIETFVPNEEYEQWYEAPATLAPVDEEPNLGPTKPALSVVVAQIKDALRSWPLKAVAAPSMHSRLAPGYTASEWEAIVSRVRQEVGA